MPPETKIAKRLRTGKVHEQLTHPLPNCVNPASKTVLLSTVLLAIEYVALKKNDIILQFPP